MAEPIVQLVPGEMFWLVTNPESPEVSLIICEEKFRIWRMSKRPKIEMRAGMITVNGVGLAVFMLCIGADENVYSTWFRNGDQANKDAIILLGQQKDILVQVFSNRLERSARIPNGVCGTFLATREAFDKMPEQPAEAYETARTQYLSEFDSPDVLWRHLSSDGFPVGNEATLPQMAG